MSAPELHDAHVQAWREHKAATPATAFDEAERGLLGEALALFAEHNADVFDEPTAEDAFILAERLGVLDLVRAELARKQEQRAERAREAIAEVAELRERLDDITRGEAGHA